VIKTNSQLTTDQQLSGGLSEASMFWNNGDKKLLPFHSFKKAKSLS